MTIVDAIHAASWAASAATAALAITIARRLRRAEPKENQVSELPNPVDRIRRVRDTIASQNSRLPAVDANGHPIRDVSDTRLTKARALRTAAADYLNDPAA